MNASDFLHTFDFVQRLERQSRSGWHQAGIRFPENVAAHTYGVAMVAMWLSDYLKEGGVEVDVEKVLRMALLHDIGEAITTDIPKPVKAGLSGFVEVERDAERRVLAKAPESWDATLTRYGTRTCTESKIVKAADGIQMMLMGLQYERESRLELDSFFEFKGSEFGIVSEIVEHIRYARLEK